MNDIFHAICDYYKIQSSQIVRDTREQQTVFYRHVFYYLAKTKNEYSYDQMTRFLKMKGAKKQNHATVIHAIKVIDNRVRLETQVREDIVNLKENLKHPHYPKIVISNFDLLDLCIKPQFLNA